MWLAALAAWFMAFVFWQVVIKFGWTWNFEVKPAEPYPAFAIMWTLVAVWVSFCCFL